MQEEKIIVLTIAVRDEGTLYHYLEPAREVGRHKETLEIFEGISEQRNLDYFL
ncbi:MAG: hypothetical protein KHZ72_11810 [Lachnospiraceae bacterium]|nr:hypothetical protein [Lachnospiraceae bacterium]